MTWAVKMRYEKTEKWYEQLRTDISIRATEKMKWATEKKDLRNWDIISAIEKGYDQLKKDTGNLEK